MPVNHKRRQGRRTINYNETSPPPPPSLSFARPRSRDTTSVRTIHLPEVHEPHGEYFVEVNYWHDNRPEYLPIPFACNKFNILKDWFFELAMQNDEHMTEHLFDVIKNDLSVEVEPQFEIGTIGLVSTVEDSALSYVVITAINSNLTC
eukprot:839355_1